MLYFERVMAKRCYKEYKVPVIIIKKSGTDAIIMDNEDTFEKAIREIGYVKQSPTLGPAPRGATDEAASDLCTDCSHPTKTLCPYYGECQRKGIRMWEEIEPYEPEPSRAGSDSGTSGRAPE